MKRLFSLICFLCLFSTYTHADILKLFEHLDYSEVLNRPDIKAIIDEHLPLTQFRNEFEENPMRVINLEGEDLWHKYKYLILDADAVLPNVVLDEISAKLISDRSFLSSNIPDASLEEEKKSSQFIVNKIDEQFLNERGNQIRVRVNVKWGIGPIIHALVSCRDDLDSTPRKRVCIIEKTRQSVGEDGEKVEPTKPEIIKLVLTIEENEIGAKARLTGVLAYEVPCGWLGWVANKGFKFALDFFDSKIKELVDEFYENLKNYEGWEYRQKKSTH